MNSMTRRIEQRHPTTGELTGIFETSLSDAELVARDREAASRRDALLATNLSVTMAARQAEQAEAEALDGIGLDDHARDRLRAAHAALAAAREDLGRRREVVAKAALHVERCEASAAAARQVVDGIAERATTAIVAQLEQGQAPSAPTPTRAAAERAEAARAELEHAIAARAEVERATAAAERAVTESATHLKEAARGVIRLRVFELRAEIDGLNEQLEERKNRLNTLLPTLYERRWPVPWPAEAEALLTDPEACL